MKLVIYNRLRPKVAHLIDTMPRLTLCGRMYPGIRGDQIIYTDSLRLCEICTIVLRNQQPMESEDGQ